MILYFLDCLVEQNILGVEKVEFRLAKIEYLVEKVEFRVAQFTNTENRKRRKCKTNSKPPTTEVQIDLCIHVFARLFNRNKYIRNL